VLQVILIKYIFLVPSQHQMLFEAQASRPKKIPPRANPRPLTTAMTPLKTCRRRPHSDAAWLLLPFDIGFSPPTASQELQAREEAHPCRDESSTISVPVPPEPVAELVPGIRPTQDAKEDSSRPGRNPIEADEDSTEQRPRNCQGHHHGLPG
jgi:hypothetical protein